MCPTITSARFLCFESGLFPFAGRVGQRVGEAGETGAVAGGASPQEPLAGGASPQGPQVFFVRGGLVGLIRPGADAEQVVPRAGAVGRGFRGRVGEGYVISV